MAAEKDSDDLQEVENVTEKEREIYFAVRHCTYQAGLDCRGCSFYTGCGCNLNLKAAALIDSMDAKIRTQEKKIEELNRELRRARFAAFNDDPPDED